MTQRAYNFNAGPSALPLEVLENAQQQLVNFRNSGMSIMEMSHRSAIFDEVHNEAIALLKKLYAIPENYEVLFLQGGASLQFTMVPMNFLQADKKQAMYYLVHGQKKHSKKLNYSVHLLKQQAQRKINIVISQHYQIFNLMKTMHTCTLLLTIQFTVLNGRNSLKQVMFL